MEKTKQKAESWVGGATVTLLRVSLGLKGLNALGSFQKLRSVWSHGFVKIL